MPWARLALGQVNCGVLFHSASLFGSYFITFAIVAVNGLAAYAILHLDKVKLISILCACVFGANLISGLIGYLTLRQDPGEGTTVAAVQGNVGSAEKWQLGTVSEAMDIYREYTKQADEAGATVVVFPETFLPYSISADSSLGKYVSDLAKECGVTIRCGAFYHSPDGGYYNGLFTAYPDGTYAETVYAKRRLVPFGEFVPMRPVVEVLVPVLADMGMLDSDLDQGTDSAVVDTVIGPAGSLICFDSIYEELTLDAVRDGAAYICLSTNDSWFGTSAGIRMHLRQAQLRAVESGRYIIRSAATGVSAIVTPTGECLEVQDADTAGVAIANIHSRTDRTLYSYIGNTLVYLLITAELALGVTLLIDRIRRRRMMRIAALEAEDAPTEENTENTQE